MVGAKARVAMHGTGPVSPALRWYRQEDQDRQVILGYKVSLKLSWTMRNTISKQKAGAEEIGR